MVRQRRAALWCDGVGAPTSSGDVYSMISVHRFELRIVPRFCWFDLRFAASLYSMYGVPVSI